MFSIFYQPIGQTQVYQFNSVEKENANLMNPKRGVMDWLRLEP